MALTSPTMTAEDLLRHPSDGCRYELIRGELRQIPPAGEEYGDVAMQFGWRLAQFVTTNDLGKVYAAETGFILSTNPDTVRAPDVAFIKKENLGTERQRGFRSGAPDLAVEVISPGDTYPEVEEKAMDWLSAGCQRVIVLNPRNRTVTVFVSPKDISLFTESETLDLGELVSGWSIAVREIFSR